MAESGYTGQPYGQAKAQEQALATVPMEEAINPMIPEPVKPGGFGNLMRPTQLPSQPITAEADVQPIATIPQKSVNVARIMSSMLQLASSPLSSPSTRRIVRAMQQLVPNEE